MREKALNLLGLMRKANALRIGEEETGAAVREHEAKLVLLASDASPNARKRASGYMYGSKAPLITVPFTKEEISEHVGKPGCSMAAVCDIGFADALMQRMCDISPEEYIAAALAPSEVVSVTMLEDGKSCRVIVPDSQLSLAIGKEGQNARLAARLTGFKIDIKPESEA